MFAITKVHGKTNSYAHREFLLNSLDDLDKLPRYGVRGTQNNPDDTVADEPCAIGSEATIVTGTDTYMYILTPDNQWTPM